MPTIKNTTAQLGNLINQMNGNSMQPAGVPSGVAIDDDSMAASMLDMPPAFEMNYKSIKKQCIKKAKDSIKLLVKDIVPENMQQTAIILDKINQDAEQLGNLYYEYEKNDKVVQALMDAIARGEINAKLFDVYTKFSKINQDLSRQITDTQNQLRKYYIDTYLDVQQKADNDALPPADTKMTALPSSNHTQYVPGGDNGNIIVGTEDITKMLNQRKKEALLAQYTEAKKE